MAASKQASTYICALLQCSPTSVGLGQARPNYKSELSENGAYLAGVSYLENFCVHTQFKPLALPRAFQYTCQF